MVIDRQPWHWAMRTSSDTAARRRPSRVGAARPGHLEQQRRRGTHRVARGVDDHGGQMRGVHVDGEDPLAPQLLERRGRRGRGFPRRVQVPAAPVGVEGDVVADGAAGRLGGHLVAPVGEVHWRRQAPAAVGRWPAARAAGELDLDPTLLGVPADGLVAPGLVRLAVGGDEPARCFPSPAPRRLAEPGLVEMVTGAGLVAPASTDGHPSLLESGLDLAQPGLEHLETALLGEALRRAGVAAGPASRSPHGHRQPTPDATDPGSQAGPLGTKVSLAQRPGVLAGAGDGPGPARRAHRGQGPLALPA